MKKLNLGKELTKNAQKKVSGGADFVCLLETYPWDLHFVIPWMSCSTAEAYCRGHQGEMVVCYP